MKTAKNYNRHTKYWTCMYCYASISYTLCCW